MTLKEQIKHLEEIANQERRPNMTSEEIAMMVGEIRVAKQALVIIKKQNEIIEKSRNYLKECSDLAKNDPNLQNCIMIFRTNINKLLEEND